MRKIGLVMLLMLCLVSVALAQDRTRGEIMDRTRQSIKEKSTTENKYWPDTNLADWINDAQGILDLTIGSSEAETTYVCTLGTESYPLPGGFIAPKAIRLLGKVITDGTYVSSRTITIVDPEVLGIGPLIDGGVPIQACFWADSLMFWPTPRTTSSVKFFYYQESALMDSSADTCSLSNGEAALIPLWVAGQAWLKKSEDGRAQYLIGLFDQYRKEMYAFRRGHLMEESK